MIFVAIILQIEVAFSIFLVWALWTTTQSLQGIDASLKQLADRPRNESDCSGPL